MWVGGVPLVFTLCRSCVGLYLAHPVCPYHNPPRTPQVDKSKKAAANNNNNKAKAAPTKVAIPVGFHSGKRESPATRGPFVKKEGAAAGGERRADSAGTRGGRGGARGGFSASPRGAFNASDKPAPAPKRSVNVADDKAFPSLA